MVIGVLACKVSSIMFQENIARSYYKKKKSKKDIGLASSILSMFERIKFSKLQVVLDNLVYSILNPCSCLMPTKKFACFKRKRFLERCEARFLAELDVNTILKKLRYSATAFATQFEDCEIKKYLKLNRSITVNDSSSEEEDLFDENVQNGFFTSDENDEEPQDIPDERSEFSTKLREMILIQIINDI